MQCYTYLLWLCERLFLLQQSCNVPFDAVLLETAGLQDQSTLDLKSSILPRTNRDFFERQRSTKPLPAFLSTN